MTRRLEKQLKEYETTLKDIYKELVVEREHLSPTELSLEIDEIYYTRYGLGEAAAPIDEKYLPAIYDVIVSKYPEAKEHFLKSLQVAGVNVSVLQKTPA